MFIKILILTLLALILLSLTSGLFFLIRDKGRSERTVKALTVRIALSVALFAILVVGYLTGHIHPHGIYPATPPAGGQPR